MGVVYLAERADEHFEKRVALKLMPRGLETREKERRFLIERQILARLEHPGIARLLDGGVTDEGFPYLVMEHIDGEPIDDYCRNRSLSVRERLELMKEVCAAVQYAHQNLVVHRDLKPSNILVTSDGEIKLLDFGVGKILEETEDDPATVFQPLTPEYASPEQVENQPVSTATDVYSLGVLLYRLLTGTTPHRLSSSSSGTPDAERAQTTTKPPSRAVGTASQTAEGEAPPLPPQKLQRRLEGDLDTIVLKALRMEPERRYTSVGELSDDIERHLEGRPIHARRSTWRYRAGKFVGRHRISVAAGALMAFLVVAGVTAIAWQGRIAAHERDRARVEAQRAERVADFLSELFDAANPRREQGEQITARELLHQAETRIRTELAEEPELRAQLLDVMARAYSGIGDFDKALDLARDAVAALRGRGLESNLELAKSLTTQGAIHFARGEYDEGDAALVESAQLHEAEDPVSTEDMAVTLGHLAQVRNAVGKVEEAEAMLHRALSIWRQSGNEEQVALTNHILATALENRGDLETALQLKQESLAVLRRLHGEENPVVAQLTNNVAFNLHNSGRFDEAEELYRQALAVSERRLGPGHVEVAEVLSNIGRVLMDQGRYVDAEPLAQRAAEIMIQSVDEDHFQRIACEINLASCQSSLGQHDSAIAAYRSTLDRFSRLLGEEHQATARVKSLLAQSLQRRGELEEAERLLSEALLVQRDGGSKLNQADSLIGLGSVQRDLNQASRAEPSLRQGLALRQEELVPGHWLIGEAQLELAGALHQLDRIEEASVLFSEGTELLSGLPPDDVWLDNRVAILGERLASHGSEN
jgi:serine/threonine-protein kinase